MPYTDRETQRRVQRADYLENREEYKQRSRKSQHNRRLTINKIKEKDPCKDCGKRYPAHVMQFDHVSGTKIMSISQMIARFKMETILAEIAKCEVVCANCHADRTFQRKQHKSTLGLDLLATPRGTRAQLRFKF